jgi:hypothetical protein
MRNMMKNWGSRGVVITFILLLGAWPVGATVPADIAAGAPLDRVIANGLGAGLTLEAILGQALDAGANPEKLFKAAVAQGGDLTRLFKYFLDRCASDPKLKDTCSACALMKWAKEAGKDAVEIANAMMAAGSNLQQVRDCLASMGLPNADTYAYTPPGPPAAPLGAGPSFPGGGGGGGGAGGGAGTASPSR